MQIQLALAQAYKLDVLELETKIERLKAVLREHDITMPGNDPLLGASDGEHLMACRTLVVKAYEMLEKMDEFEQALSELRSLVGSGMELVGGESWRKS